MSFIKSLFTRKADKRFHVPADVVERFKSRPDFPWLISFPRTGSHWLRMLMELYFEKPSLVRVFYFFDATDFTCYHWHDVDLATEGVRSVIYLYRNPVDTVYSTLRYHRENIDDPARVTYWSNLYGRHLAKWLLEETFTETKTIVRYEGLKSDPAKEFSRICAHFGTSLDAGRLEMALTGVSKRDLKKKTRDDRQVVNLSHSYAEERRRFGDRWADEITTIVLNRNDRLATFFQADESMNVHG